MPGIDQIIDSSGITEEGLLITACAASFSYCFPGLFVKGDGGASLMGK